MLIGVPRELKNHEYRVAVTPAGVHELVRRGHQVVLERDAGAGSSLPDAEYLAEGATILDTADEVWAAADMVLKVKEPVAAEYHR
ncbi:MAG TPA: alanine dehydrogenase, partial [Pseudonocardia sp.]